MSESEIILKAAKAILAKVPSGYGMTESEAAVYARTAIETVRDNLDEDIAAEMECQFSTEGQWQAIFDTILGNEVPA